MQGEATIRSFMRTERPFNGELSLETVGNVGKLFPVYRKSVVTEVPCTGDLCEWDWILNSTDITKNGSNDSTVMDYRDDYNWAVLLLSPLVFFGLTGNILVIMAISMEKRLQSVTNYFLLSLAVTDLLVCLIVMPFSIINEATGYWIFGLLMCELYVASDVLMCTSSILHLCTISLERYIAIRSPLNTRNRSKSVVILKIILIWATALGISSPIMVLGLLDETNVLIKNGTQCVLNNEHFIIYGSICAFFIPLGIMVIAYALTTYLLRKQATLCNLNQRKEGQPMIRRSKSRRAIRQRMHVKFPTRRTKSCPVGEPSQYKESDVRKKQIAMTLPRQRIGHRRDSSQQSKHGTSFEADPEDNHTKTSERQTGTWPSAQQNNSRLKNLVKKHHLVIKATNILLLKKDTSDGREKDSVQTEQKASKVLGVVFSIFVICWAPFFILNIMTVLCKDCTFEPTLISVLTWLGYVSSTLNPIIYTMFNRTFKMTFLKLLRCQYDYLQRTKRTTSWRAKNGETYQFNNSSSTTFRSTFCTQQETPC